MTTIRDGTGSGSLVKVGSDNRLSVRAENVSSLAVASAEGARAFSANTGSARIALTAAAGESAVLYLRNDSESPLSVGGLFASSSQPGVWRFYRNPTGGTITTAGTTISPVQLNFASARQFDGLLKYGASGQTITGGTVLALGYVMQGFRALPLDGAAILTTGSTFGLTFTPDADTLVTATAVVSFLE